MNTIKLREDHMGKLLNFSKFGGQIHILQGVFQQKNVQHEGGQVPPRTPSSVRGRKPFDGWCAWNFSL
jgi:hypothetical protein